MNIRPLLFVWVTSTLAATILAPVAAQTPTPAPAPSVPAAAAVPAPPVTYKDGMIKIGDESKQTQGRVTDVDKGDNGCFLTFKDEKGREHIELGKFELCSQKPSLKGKRVELAYSVETIQAASCYGDPKCKKTETVPLVVGVKIVD